MISYKKYVLYYKFINECKNHCVHTQEYELATNIRHIERTFFTNMTPVSQWYSTPEVEFDENLFIYEINKMSDRFDIKWLTRDLKLRMIDMK